LFPINKVIFMVLWFHLLCCSDVILCNLFFLVVIIYLVPLSLSLTHTHTDTHPRNCHSLSISPFLCPSFCLSLPLSPLPPLSLPYSSLSLPSSLSPPSPLPLSPYIYLTTYIPPSLSITFSLPISLYHSYLSSSIPLSFPWRLITNINR
jgi:hypothetical protein